MYSIYSHHASIMQTSAIYLMIFYCIETILASLVCIIRHNHATVSIDMYTALLGGDILLQTQNGKLKLKVKPETQNGAKIRLRGKGYQKPDGTYGNLIITYKVNLPTGLTEHQRDLLRQMRDCV